MVETSSHYILLHHNAQSQNRQSSKTAFTRAHNTRCPQPSGTDDAEEAMLACAYKHRHTWEREKNSRPMLRVAIRVLCSVRSCAGSHSKRSYKHKKRTHAELYRSVRCSRFWPLQKGARTATPHTHVRRKPPDAGVVQRIRTHAHTDRYTTLTHSLHEHKVV